MDIIRIEFSDATSQQGCVIRIRKGCGNAAHTNVATLSVDTADTAQLFTKGSH